LDKLLIHVGSTSEHKLAAVRGACEDLCLRAEVAGFPTASGVNEQPEGVEEAFSGASTRALGAWRAVNATPVISVGIESAIVKTHSILEYQTENWVDAAVVIVYDAPHRFQALSAGHAIDTIDVEEARWRGFDKHTVSSVTRERTGCDPNDSTPVYTGGRVTRVECLRQAVKIALAQWLTWRERAS
jgi:non-canonical (house-cleaning) NTP pyrophosphatase